MENLFKKFIYASVGFASLTAKRFAETINDLQAQGKISEEEGERIMSNFEKATNRTREEYEKDMRDLLEKMLEKMEVASKRDIDDLHRRIDSLEGQMRYPEAQPPVK